MFWRSIIHLMALAISLLPSITLADSITVRRLLDDIRTENVPVIVQSLNDIRVSEYHHYFLPVLLDIWRKDLDKYPDLPWAVLEMDEVKITIADILIQAKSNRELNIDVSNIADYVRSQIDNPVTSISSQAILTTSFLRDPDDVPRLYDVAKSGNSRLFGVAIVGLAFICSDSSVAALRALSKSAKTAEIRSYAKETIAQLKSHFFCDR